MSERTVKAIIERIIAKREQKEGSRVRQSSPVRVFAARVANARPIPAKPKPTRTRKPKTPKTPKIESE